MVKRLTLSIRPYAIALAVVLYPQVPASVLADVPECSVVKDGMAEVVTFPTKTQDGHAVPVHGILMKPGGNGPFPALVVLHGRGGIYRPHCYGGALRRFVDWGYTALLVDSTSARDPSGTRGSQYSFVDQAQDAHKAHAFLRGLRYVDAGRVGIVGWSTGGLATLIAVSNNRPSPENHSFEIEKHHTFEAAAAFYPICLDEIDRLEAPLLVMIGKKDVVVSAQACEDMRLVGPTTHEVDLVVYPNAGHVFDYPRSSNYKETSAKDAWRRLHDFFAKRLR